MVTDDRGSPPPGEPERFTPAREAALVGMTLCAAFAVRFIPALWPSFWWDEVFTVAMSNRPLSDIVRLTSRDVHPPLYYFVVHLLMAIGDRLGGLLTSLTWLRMASIVPGLLTCWIAWWAARRCWGPRSASLVLILFAFSPALAFYSVELRNYSISHAALLGSTIFLLSVTSGAGSRPWAAVCGYVLCMSIALYSTNLALLYLIGHGVIFLIEILWLSTNRKRLFMHGATALAATLALYSFWIPTVISQNAHLNTMKLGWLPAAQLKDVFSTFFFYLPYGPIGPFDTAWVWDGWPRLLMLATMVGFATLGIALLLQRKAAAQPRSSGDRLFLYAGLMTVIPLGLAFIASVSGIARIFLPLRYNLLAVPFCNLFFIRCLLLLKPGSVRRIALIATLSASAGFTLFLQAHRVRDRDDFRCLEAEVFGAEKISDDDRFYWLAPELLPWLNQIGKFQVGSYETALNSPEGQAGSVWFLSHQVTRGGWGRTRLPSRL
ncbi:glycosyltransferase family 39 protein, partial [Candidatus Sumerlaeota bacterium]|nr:glycosyltransferase family 39 protein [Candidatus Sumerlaeota bacterium]